MRIYPNPTNGLLYISFSADQEVSKTTIINQQGQAVINIQGPIKAVDLSSLAPGIYNVQLIVDGISINKTIVKK